MVRDPLDKSFLLQYRSSIPYTGTKYIWYRCEQTGIELYLHVPRTPSRVLIWKRRMLIYAEQVSRPSVLPVDTAIFCWDELPVRISTHHSRCKFCIWYFVWSTGTNYWINTHTLIPSSMSKKTRVQCYVKNNIDFFPIRTRGAIFERQRNPTYRRDAPAWATVHLNLRTYHTQPVDIPVSSVYR